MGTNYYVRTNNCDSPCEHCTENKQTHLGKASKGWEFLFHANPVWTPDNSMANWIDLAKSGQISDEYGRPISFSELLRVVVNHCGANRNPGISWSIELFEFSTDYFC